MTKGKRRFGQNFLTNLHTADCLVNALRIEPAEAVLEVGPGTGILTDRILQTGANLVAIEIDKDLIALLCEKYNEKPKLNLVQGDIIKIDPDRLAPNGFKLIGNLPFNISGAFFEWLVQYNKLVKMAVITVQKEVADRVRARPGSRNYGSLTVMVQSFYDVQKLFNIPPGSFSPRPEVYSTALSLTPHRKIDDDIDFISFRDFLRACFAQKRKTLANSLFASQVQAGLRLKSRTQIERILTEMRHAPNIRAEQLSLSEFLEIYRILMAVK
jgi:16S rRNA (adenine1518-N6/adenine1519-N6)-dimethyltransferase